MKKLLVSRYFIKYRQFNKKIKNREDNYVLTEMTKQQVCELVVGTTQITNKLKYGQDNVLRFFIKEVSKVFNIEKKIN